MPPYSTPRDERKRELQKVLLEIQEQANATADDVGAFSNLDDCKLDDDRERAATWVDVPLEAICQIYLDEAWVTGDVEQSFDFNQESQLEVNFRGFLLFPPKANWGRNQILAAKSAKEADAAPATDSRWHIKVEVFALLEHQPEESLIRLHGSESCFPSTPTGWEPFIPHPTYATRRYVSNN